MDWGAISKATRAAFAKAIDDWIVASRVQGGSVQGPNAELTPGSLGSAVDLERRMLQVLQGERVPAAVARALAQELGGAWRAWADGFRLSLPGAYPRLGAVPGPAAAPTPSARSAYPIARGTSTGEHRLKAATLSRRLHSALRLHGGRDAAGRERAIQELASWVEASFREWKRTAQVVGLMGRGPVPSYAPPYVPVGPVVMGDNVGTPGHTAAIAGPRFGKLGR